MATGTKGIRAGKAYVELYADQSKLARGLKTAEKQLRDFGQRIRNIGIGLTAAGSAIATGLGLSAKVFGDFEQQMAMVSTMLEEPQKWMDRFAQGIRDMSMEFGEATAALAGGLYDILSASIDPAQAMDVLGAAVKAARAGMSDTKTAADAITTVLNAYGLAAERAGDISDLLFSVVKRGKTTFAELASGIGNVASIAASGNVSLEELGASLATMTRNGVKTDRAITALNAIISAFLKPQAQSAAYARELGFEMSSVTLQTEGLLGVFERISALPPDAISKLFPNVEALKGVLPALKNMTGFTADLDIMTQRAGAADDAFAKMAGTLNMFRDRIRQTMSVILSTIGESFADILKKASEHIVAVGKAIVDWIAKNKQVVLTIGTIVVGVTAVGVALTALGYVIIGAGASLGALAGVITGVTGAVMALVTAVKTAAVGAFAALLTPMGAVLGVIAVLGSYFLYTSGAIGKGIDWLAKKFGVLKDDTLAAFGGIRDALLAGDITLAAKILWLLLKTEWQRGINFIKTIWYNAQYHLTAAWFGLESAWIEVVATLRKVWAQFASWHAKSSNWLATQFAKGWAEVMSWFDDSFDLEFALSSIEQDQQAKSRQIDDQYQTDLGRIEAQRAADRERTDAEHEAALTGMAQEQAAKLAENQQQLDEARAAFQAAIADARGKGTAKQTDDEGPGADDFAARLQNMLAGIGEVVATKAASISVVGTFNAEAAGGLGTGSVTEQIASATQATAENTRKILSETKANKPKFG